MNANFQILSDSTVDPKTRASLVSMLHPTEPTDEQKAEFWTSLTTSQKLCVGQVREMANWAFSACDTVAKF